MSDVIGGSGAGVGSGADMGSGRDLQRGLLSREEYERELRRRQQEHLRRVGSLISHDELWQPCLHDQCQQCHGTGVKLDGTMCMHSLSCSCPKCTPR